MSVYALLFHHLIHFLLYTVGFFLLYIISLINYEGKIRCKCTKWKQVWELIFTKCKKGKKRFCFTFGLISTVDNFHNCQFCRLSFTFTFTFTTSLHVNVNKCK